MNDQDKYLKEVFDEAAKILPELEYDDMSGGIWSMVITADRMLYCTPFWENCTGIAVALTDTDGETIDTDELTYSLTNNPEIDALEFVKQIKIYLKGIKL